MLIVINFTKVTKTPLEEGVQFLRTGEYVHTATAKGLPEARERLRVDSLSAPEKQAYYRDMEAQRYQRSVIKTGWYEGRAEGRAEGRHEERESNARNLKQLGVSPEIIAKATGLSLEEIAGL